MTNKYLITFTHPESKEFMVEQLETKSTRKAKVLDKIYDDFLKKYQFPITEVENLQMFKL